MSKKAFVTSGLALIHLYIFTIAAVQYFGISSLISLDLLPVVRNSIFLAIILSFGGLLYLRFKEIGRQKRTLIWCFAFYIGSAALGGLIAWLYFVTINAVTDTHWEHITAIKEGRAVTTWMYIKYVLHLVPVSYLVNWGLFALLVYGCLTPTSGHNSGTRPLNEAINPRIGSYVRNLPKPALGVTT